MYGTFTRSMASEAGPPAVPEIRYLITYSTSAICFLRFFLEFTTYICTYVRKKNHPEPPSEA